MDKDKFAPRVNQTKMEKTGERNSDYSSWHRTLGREYLAVDIDFVEYRQNRGIVAFLAVTGRLKDEKHRMNSKRFIWKRTAIERQIMTELSSKTGVPAFFTIHNNDFSIFHVHNLAEDLSKFERMNQNEYGEFIKLL